MAKKTKDNASCGAAMENLERQWPDCPFGLRSRPVEDPSLTRLRQTFNEFPPPACWEEIRSRLLAALSDLPDGRRPYLHAARHLPPIAPGNHGESGFLNKPGICHGECPQAGLPESVFLPTAVPAPWRRRKIVTIAVMLLVIMPLILLRRNTRSTHPHLFPPATQSSARSSTSSHLPSANLRAATGGLRAPATITAVQHEFTAASTTAMIVLTSSVDYEVRRLTAPERVYIDFHNARLVPRMEGRNFIVGKPCLRQYRLGSHPGQTARVTFETGAGCEFSAQLTGAPFIKLVLLLRPIPPHR